MKIATLPKDFKGTLNKDLNAIEPFNFLKDGTEIPHEEKTQGLRLVKQNASRQEVANITKADVGSHFCVRNAHEQNCDFVIVQTNLKMKMYEEVRYDLYI